MSLTLANAVVDSTALAALPVPLNITPGTQAWNEAVGAYFVYTSPSSASLVTDQVVEVFGINGARWIKSSGGGVATVVAGTGISVNSTDPANPVVSSTVDPGTLADSGASALTNWTFATGLNGNTDGNYQCDMIIPIAAAGAAMELAFNADSTPSGINGAYLRGASGGTANAAGVTKLFIGSDPVGGTGTLTVSLKFISHASLVRSVTGQACYLDAGGTRYIWSFSHQIAASNTTNITDLRILSDTASGIGAHSTVVWRKLNQTAF